MPRKKWAYPDRATRTETVTQEISLTPSQRDALTQIAEAKHITRRDYIQEVVQVHLVSLKEQGVFHRNEIQQLDAEASYYGSSLGGEILD